MRRNINILSNTDWLTIFIYIALVIFGWMNVFAVNYSPDDANFFSLSNRYTTQLAWMLISFLVIVLIFIIDSRFYSFIAYPTYILAILVLIAVLLVGTTINNARSWIVIGPLSIQPAEFAKLATILAIAKYISRANIKLYNFKNVLAIAGITFLPALLIMLQPDFGSTLVYGVILLALYREGLSGWLLVIIAAMAALFLATLIYPQFAIIIVINCIALVVFGLICRKLKNFVTAVLIEAFYVGLLFNLKYFEVIDTSNYILLLSSIFLMTITGLVFAIKKKMKAIYGLILAVYLIVGMTYGIDYAFNNVVQDYQRKRVNIMLGLESDPYGYEYNVRQSKIAIGSGGFAGKGFMKGTQTKFQFVPEQSTDFIFCTVGEEWGFIGSGGLVLMYVALLLRLIYLAERQRSRFSRVFGYGVISIYFFHFAVNIGMTIGLFPVIGIPLPFLSYGGSALLAFSMMLFIFLRLDASRKKYLI